jgi:hypothetical protein
MGIQRAAVPSHWNYFIALEEDLDRLTRYVDLAGQNDNTYSIEIARLLLSASAEVDVVLKGLVKKRNVQSLAASINAYHPEVTAKCPNFIRYSVIIPRYGLTLTPWIDWAANSPPKWWSDNNKVKHHRDQYFDLATLKNCLNAVAALMVSVIHLYADEALNGGLLLLPRLFNVGDEHFAGTQMGRFGNSFCYRT